MTRQPQLVVCIGDVAGHLDSFASLLHGCGIDTDTAHIPHHLTVVQVGDLVHRGPDSAEVVVLVDRLLRNNPGRWIQLIGNHEEPYVFDDTTSAIRPLLPAATADIIRSWWHDGLATAAVAVTPHWYQPDKRTPWRDLQPSGDVLITHAGLTHGAWRLLGEPTTAQDAADRINTDARASATILRREGAMTTGVVDPAAGPLWANRGTELLEPWAAAGDDAHFHQAHGHTTVRNWQHRDWYPGAEALQITGDLIADHTRSIETARIGQHVFWGIDPGHGRQPTTPWEPLILCPGAVAR